MTMPLVPGRRLPPFRLPLVGGGDMRPSSYRGRANLALFMLPGDDLAAVTACLTVIAARLPDYRERHAWPLVVVSAPLNLVAGLQTSPPAFPLAADADGRVRARLVDLTTAEHPMVALTDRYAETRAVLTGWAAVGEAGQAEVLDVLRRIDYLCSV